MKKFTKILTIGAILATTNIYASNLNYSVSAGMTNIELGSICETATSINLNMKKQYSNLSFEMGYTQGDKLAVTKFGVLYDYPINDKIKVGANLMAHGINYTDDNSASETTFSGYTAGIQTSYDMTKNSSLSLSYGTGTATNSTGLVDFDLTLTSLAYKYKF